MSLNNFFYKVSTFRFCQILEVSNLKKNDAMRWKLKKRTLHYNFVTLLIISIIILIKHSIYEIFAFLITQLLNLEIKRFPIVNFEFDLCSKRFWHNYLYKIAELD